MHEGRHLLVSLLLHLHHVRQLVISLLLVLDHVVGCLGECVDGLLLDLLAFVPLHLLNFAVELLLHVFQFVVELREESGAGLGGHVVILLVRCTVSWWLVLRSGSMACWESLCRKRNGGYICVKGCWFWVGWLVPMRHVQSGGVGKVFQHAC